MFILFLFLGLGIGIGVLLRRFSDIAIIGKLTMVVIIILLFLLGKSVGKNEAIMQNLPSIGLQAFAISSAALLGSVLLAKVVYKFYFEKKQSDEK